MSQEENKWKNALPTVSIAVIILAALFVAFYMMGNDNSWFSIKQIIGIIVAAVISGVITVILLKEQSETQEKMLNRQEETKDKMLEEQRKSEVARAKDVKIYSNKIAAFSSFNKSVWTDDLDDVEKAAEIVENIRKQLYSKVILYLNTNEIKTIQNLIPEEGTNNFPVVLSGIIGILNRNAEKNLSDNKTQSDSNNSGQEEDKYQEACKDLWDKFSGWSGSFEKSVDGEDADFYGESRSIKVQAWHFCEWSTRQLDRLDDGFNELSLVEYGEYWRTKLVKEVKKGDLVFLFRGSKKYAGAFIAKGWRVFMYDEKRMVEEIVSDGIERVLPEGKSSIKDPGIASILEKYDIFESYKKDDSTSCANVVCERVSYFREGVDNPNTTYRKTISRYYEGYAVKLLEEFRKKEKDNVSLKKINDLFSK